MLLCIYMVFTTLSDTAPRDAYLKRGVAWCLSVNLRNSPLVISAPGNGIQSSCLYSVDGLSFAPPWLCRPRKRSGSKCRVEMNGQIKRHEKGARNISIQKRCHGPACRCCRVHQVSPDNMIARCVLMEISHLLEHNSMTPKWSI
jgi:hypothetical protein